MIAHTVNDCLDMGLVFEKLEEYFLYAPQYNGTTLRTRSWYFSRFSTAGWHAYIPVVDIQWFNVLSLHHLDQFTILLSKRKELYKKLKYYLEEVYFPPESVTVF